MTPVYVDNLREYSKGKQIPYIYVEIFRDGESLKKKMDKVLKGGLANKESREAAADYLGMDDWNEPDGPKNESEIIFDFSELYWKKVVQEGWDFQLGISSEGQHRNLMCIAASCGSAYDHLQPVLKKNTISKEVFIRSGVFKKKEHEDNQEYMNERVEKLDCTELVKKSMAGGELAHTWNIYVTRSKNKSQMDMEFGEKQYGASEYHTLMFYASTENKVENRTTGNISTVERIMSFITRIEESNQRRGPIAKERIKKINDTIKVQPVYTNLNKDKPTNESEYIDKYPKPAYLQNDKFKEYLATGEESLLQEWRKFCWVHGNDGEQQYYEFPPFTLTMEDMKQKEKNKEEKEVDLVALNNTVLYREILSSFYEFGNIEEQQTVGGLAEFLLHHHNSSGISFDPTFHPGIEFDDANIENSTNLVLNPKLASTVLLAYVYNSCMLYDKNVLNYRLFLLKLREYEIGNGNVKLETTLGKCMLCFFVFVWTFQ